MIQIVYTLSHIHEMNTYMLAGYQISISDRKDCTNDVLCQQYQITMPYQSHSCDVAYCKYNQWYRKINADGLITSDIKIWVWGHDCMMIAVLGYQYYAVCHAGWRWLTSGIVWQVVQKMIWLGELWSELQIVYGPHIRSCCFEISSEIACLRGVHCLYTKW